MPHRRVSGHGGLPHRLLKQSTIVDPNRSAGVDHHIQPHSVGILSFAQEEGRFRCILVRDLRRTENVATQHTARSNSEAEFYEARSAESSNTLVLTDYVLEHGTTLALTAAT